MSHAKAVVLLVVVLGSIVLLAQWVLEGEPLGAGDADAAAIASDEDEFLPDTAQVEDPSPEPSREAEVAQLDGDMAVAAESTVPRPRARYLVGEVRDDQGRPLAAATVLWGTVSKAPGVGAPEAQVTVLTNARGRFRLEDLPLDGSRSLFVWHDQHPTLSVGNLYPPSTGLDLGVLIMEPGGRVYGRVQGPDGRPVTDAVVAFAKEDNTFWMSPELGVRRVQSDENGSFLLTGLAQGTGVLWSEREGFARARQQGVEVVAGQDAGPFPLMHEEGVSLFGRVVDADAEPVPEARIDVVPRSRPWYEREEIRTLTSDAQGRFSTPGLSLETLTLTVSAEGFGRLTKNNVIPGESVEVTLQRVGAVVCRVVDAADGADVEQVAFTQEGQSGLLDVEELDDGRYRVRGAGPGKTRLVAKAQGYGQGRTGSLDVPANGIVEDVTISLSRGAVVRGLVRNREGGAPVPGVKVLLVQIHEQNMMEYQVLGTLGGFESRMPSAASDTTDEEGRFELAGVTGGHFRLRTEHADFAATVEELALEQDQLHPEVVLEIGVGGTLKGFVMDHQGLPLAGQTVRVEREHWDLPSRSATTGADGSYLLERLAVGAWRADWHRKQQQGSSQGWAFNVMLQGPKKEPPKGTALRMEDGATVTMDFRDEPPCTVQGFVTTKEGPVEGAKVSLSGGPRRSGVVFMGTGPEAVTDSAGFYRIGDLEPGNYRASVLHPEAPVPMQQGLGLAERRIYDQDFLLEGAILEGTVLSPDRRPVEGAVVTLSGGRGSTSVSFDGMGAQRVVLNDLSWSASSLHGGTSSSVRAPVKTDAEGRFRMILVPDGKYRVHARHEEYRSASGNATVKDSKCEQDCVVTLQRAASIRVEVRSEATGRPVTGVMVRLRQDGGRQRNSARTDAKGQVQFQSLQDGDYKVQVDGDKGRVERVVSVSAGGEVPVVINL